MYSWEFKCYVSSHWQVRQTEVEIIATYLLLSVCKRMFSCLLEVIRMTRLILPMLNYLKIIFLHTTFVEYWIQQPFGSHHNYQTNMTWPFSESIKKRACRYLLHRYLGNFLQEKLSLDQLSLDLYQGTGSLAQVPLDKWVSSTFVM